ncbi:hypothetical protein IU500_26250 [Nocardia terpenica]|uniref:WXG100 family type VII secretion target n=1 Tax=Nocardia terpenica TaxID=455432 RepID=A0A164I7R7_9NOCA|nr:type VII secretion target [Nocardia terpenica]KZM69175.1 hypothetical protein AWN90_15780 [Nocardia terpenica]MBF6061691.1 hypothetical protein [Nocardia terpenica]MBF6107514.1 hypothetical protein [Nocardia terpenica]MBF6110111.1 hypothetical protein [Nocardia terpenica]MBF6122377.1 hypothetical protein [Nocardia terpenica]
MADRIEAETQHLRNVAGELDGVAGQLDSILSTVSAASTTYWGKWGNDDFGEKFAGGDNGYDKSDSNLQQVVGSRSDLMRSYSSGLRDAAQSLDNMDHGNSDTFQS